MWEDKYFVEEDGNTRDLATIAVEPGKVVVSKVRTYGEKEVLLSDPNSISLDGEGELERVVEEFLPMGAKELV